MAIGTAAGASIPILVHPPLFSEPPRPCREDGPSHRICSMLMSSNKRKRRRCMHKKKCDDTGMRSFISSGPFDHDHYYYLALASCMSHKKRYKKHQKKIGVIVEKPQYTLDSAVYAGPCYQRNLQYTTTKRRPMITSWHPRRRNPPPLDCGEFHFSLGCYNV